MTLQVAQALYEKHKVLTYPRTDSRYLPEDHVATAKRVMGTFSAKTTVAVRSGSDINFVPAKRQITIKDLLTHTAWALQGSDSTG